jgi:nucleolar protein 56
MEIYKTPIGILAMEGDKIIDKALFPKDPKAIAEKLSGECHEEAAMRKKYPAAEKENRRLPMAAIAEELGFCKKSEFPALLSKINEEKAKLGVSRGFGRDKLIVNGVRAQRAMENELNTRCETLREWYSIHFPELNELLKENMDYAKVVSKAGPREEMSEAALSGILDDKRYAKLIPPVAKGSMGSPVGGEDVAAIQAYARSILDSSKQEASLRSYIEGGMMDIAPNLSAVATPYVGALLLESAGSLERLAKLPASTIQVLGANKAMFRFLKTHKKPPKYGVLYVHPLVSQAAKTNKGRIARTLASKISIAAKVDFYKGEPVGERLREESEQRAESLKS